MRSVAAIQRFFRWVLVLLPCRFHLSAEDRGSRPVWIYTAGWAAVALAAALAGVVVALGRGEPVLDGLLVGGQVGLVLVLAWVTYAVAFLLVLWARCISPASVLNLGPPAEGRRGRHGRAAADIGWRKPGDRLVTRDWLLVCLLLAVAALALSWWSGGRFERRVPVTASVVRWAGEAGAGAQWMELSYRADGRVETTVLAVDAPAGGSLPQPGMPVEVQYRAGNPGEAQLRGSTVARSEVVPRWSGLAAYILIALTLGSAVLFLAQRRRPAPGAG